MLKKLISKTSSNQEISDLLKILSLELQDKDLISYFKITGDMISIKEELSKKKEEFIKTGNIELACKTRTIEIEKHSIILKDLLHLLGTNSISIDIEP